jgi:hypothetical protein
MPRRSSYSTARLAIRFLTSLRLGQFSHSQKSHIGDRTGWLGRDESNSRIQRSRLSSMADRNGGRSARHIHCRMDWTGVQVTLWQLSREKSLIAKRSEMKGKFGPHSKANFGSDICEFESSMPSQPVRSPWRASVNTLTTTRSRRLQEDRAEFRGRAPWRSLS